MLKKIVVPYEASALRVDKLIQKTLPELPLYAIREAFSRRDVKLNGVRVTADAVAKAGDEIMVFVKDGQEKKLTVVYEDAHILLVNKPQGISVHEDSGIGATMLSMAKKHVGSDEVYLCHRLDNKTSGLLLLCKDLQSEALLREAFFERSMEKEYTCLVKGELRPPEAVKDAYLIKDAQKGKVRVITKGTVGALPIQTGYKVIEADEVSRVQVELITGRTHQIRAHMAFLGHPILGDDLYGDRQFNRKHKAKRLMLCASRLTIHVGGMLAYLDGKTFTVKVPF